MNNSNLKNMKTFITLLLSTFCIICSNAQSERSLDETKSYIVKMINEYGWEKNSHTNKVNAEFEENLLKIFIENDVLKLESESKYNLAAVYRFKGPIKKPGDIAFLVIWADYLSDEIANKWVKKTIQMDIHNYEVGEQLMIAFKHLNKLLIEQKPEIEKF